MGLLPPRTRALSRLPLGRGRARRICDIEQGLCFALAFWNGRDPILKERLFGLTGEGNHGEDVKETTGTRRHAHASWLRWPTTIRTPSSRTRISRAERGRGQGSANTSWSTPACSTRTVLADHRDYAKATPRDVCVRMRVAKHGPGSGRCTSCRRCGSATAGRGATRADGRNPGVRPRTARRRRCRQPRPGPLAARAGSEPAGHAPTLLFCENETNAPRLFGARARRPIRRTASTTTWSRAPRPSTRSAAAPKMACRYRLRVGPARRSSCGCASPRTATRRFGDVRADMPSARRGRRVLRAAPPGTTAEEAAVIRQASPGCSGGSSSTTTTWGAGSTATPPPAPPAERGRP